MRLKLEGLSLDRVLDLADLFRGGDHAGMEDFLTRQQGIADSLERYFQGMEMLAGDPQAHIQSVKGALTLAAQEGLGQEAGQEPAEIAGRQLQAQRFDFQGETGDFVRVMELAVAEDPRLEQVRQAMVALINGLDGMDYQEMEDYFREVYPQGRIQGSRWDSLDGGACAWSIPSTAPSPKARWAPWWRPARRSSSTGEKRALPTGLRWPAGPARRTCPFR